MIFADQLRNAARFAGDNEAVRLGDEALSFSDIYERSCRLTQLFAHAALVPGDKVSSLGRNRLESVEETTGVALGGFVRSPLYMHNSTSSHVYMIQRVGAKALIVDAEMWSALHDALAEAGVTLELVLVRGADQAGVPTGGHIMDYDRALQNVEANDPGVEVDDRSIHIIRFSAGTTGQPKPIALTWRNWHAMGNELLILAPPIGRNDTELVISPYSHGSGNLLWPMISAQARQLILPKFEAENALELIEKYRCSILFLVPTMIQLLVDHPDAARRDLSSLKTVFYGAAPLSEETLRKALAIWGPCMYQMYGQSEAAPVTMLRPEDHSLDGINRLSSVGRATPNSSVRIESPEGEILPPNTPGQVVITGPGQMAGIYGDEKATKARLTSDGWIRTGDIGQLDEDGYLQLTDRMEDIIISGGFNVWPAEIEKSLYAHPKIREVVAFAVPHPTWGETPAVVARVDNVDEVTEDELIKWCRDRLGSVKKPSYVVLTVEELPKSSAGKLLRRKIQSDYLFQKSSDRR
ncbi:class I adenylate-forming enzyme family protein [Nocardia sp. NPDC005745]|uniref:class I adenylate-forming enzyme family protein n=1 Tax=Nocardia sp. NPDC005745 TaxID=3157061 RepID=UPI0033E7FAB5